MKKVSKYYFSEAHLEKQELPMVGLFTSTNFLDAYHYDRDTKIQNHLQCNPFVIQKTLDL